MLFVDKDKLLKEALTFAVECDMLPRGVLPQDIHDAFAKFALQQLDINNKRWFEALGVTEDTELSRLKRIIREVSRDFMNGRIEGGAGIVRILESLSR